MIVAIDYDDTYTADPTAWSAVIRLLQEFGHKVVCVTQRVDPWMQEVHDAFEPLNVPVVSGGAPKVETAAEAGYFIDVWIDDYPRGILVARRFVGPD